MRQDKAEVRRLLDVLQTLTRMLAVSNRELERRLGLQHGTVNRLLNGTIEAKLEVVLGVARGLGMEYEELFSFVYPHRPVPKPESGAARRIRTMLEDLRPQGAKSATATTEEKPPADRAEMFQAVKRAVREILAEEGPGPGNEDGPRTGNGDE